MRRQHIQDSGIQTINDTPGNNFVEGENDNLENALQGKVKALKSLSIDIGAEIRTQNTFLDEMDSDFEGSTGLLQKAMHRLKGITKQGHWKIWLYLFLFTLFVFGVCWLVVRTR